MTMEAIAADAGVGKASLYRRWPSKAAVITEAFADDLAAPPAPDTGSVRGDALAFLHGVIGTLTLLGGPTVVAARWPSAARQARSNWATSCGRERRRDGRCCAAGLFAASSPMAFRAR